MTLFSVFASSAAQADKIDDYLTAQMARNRIPGLSVAVVREGKVVKIKSYGVANIEWDAPAGPDAAFQLASATKPLVGTALLLLVQDGKIGLDEKLSRYLPDAPTSWRDITIRHLATHTSGIPDDLKGKATNTAADVVRVASELPLDHPAKELPTVSLATVCSSTFSSVSAASLCRSCCESASSVRWGWRTPGLTT